MAQTYTRASTAWQRGSNGLWTSVADDVLPDSHYDIFGVRTTRFDPAGTNFLLNSSTPATQSVSLAAGTYVLWVDGTGSCALSGGPTGTATEGNPVSFTLGGTTSVTFTVSGSLTVFQCEQGSDPTSYIESGGTAGTRAAATLTIDTSSTFATSTLFMDITEMAKGSEWNFLWAIANASGQHRRAAGWQGLGEQRIRGSISSGSGDIETADNPDDLTYGDHFEARWVIEPTQISLGVSVNGGAESTLVTSAAVSSFASWSSPTKLFIGNGAWNPLGKRFSLRGLAYVEGIQDINTMRAAVAPLTDGSATGSGSPVVSLSPFATGDVTVPGGPISASGTPARRLTAFADAEVLADAGGCTPELPLHRNHLQARRRARCTRHRCCRS